MRYLMFVCTDPDAPADESGAGTLDVDAWVDKYDGDGTRLIGERTRTLDEATSVRRRGGEGLVTDGPYAESRDWIVGFDVLECPDLDAAIAIAAEHPMAAGGRLELRPFWVDDEPPA